MPLEALVNSHLSLVRSGTLNAQRTVAQTDSCGVQQSEITIKHRSGAFVPPKVSMRNISFQPFHIYYSQHNQSIQNYLVCLPSLKRSVLTSLVSDPPSSPPAEQHYDFLS